MSAREEILAGLRGALYPSIPVKPASREQVAGAAPLPDVPRGYRRAAGPTDLADTVALFADRLTDYRACVHHATMDTLPSIIGKILRDAVSVVVPADVPDDWLAAYTGDVLRDRLGTALDNATLDAAGAVLTGCAVAIAETGTIVLDGGAAQGRRAVTLVPDHHVCVLPADRIAASVPQALARLDSARPLTFISGPSATSDIELRRVEGVHGPRRLDVIVVSN